MGGLRIVRLEVASIHPSINAKDPSVSAKFKLTSAQRRGVPLGEHPFHGMFGIRVVVGQTAGRLSTPSLVSRLSATRCSNRARHVAAGVSRSNFRKWFVLASRQKCSCPGRGRCPISSAPRQRGFCRVPTAGFASTALKLARWLGRLGETDLRPDLRQRLNQVLDIGVGMMRRWGDAQPLGAARHGRMVDRLNIDAVAIDQYALICLHSMASHTITGTIWLGLSRCATPA